MPEVMLALGAYRFSIDTAAHQTLSRTSEYRWQSQDRLGREPAQQFVGAGNQTISLQGVIYPHYKGGLGQIDDLRDEAGQGVPLLLIDGMGWIYDLWVIKSISESQSALITDGRAQKIEFTVELAFYGDDQ